MNKSIYAPVLCALAIAMHPGNLYAQANQSLSNLTNPTAVNRDLLPNAANTFNLGSNAGTWKNLYLGNGLFYKGALTIHSVGTDNFFAGPNAGNPAATGNGNTGIGFYSLDQVTTATGNTGLGLRSLNFLTTGRYNTAVGHRALYTTGPSENNTAVGYRVMYFTTTGSNNTASGYLALTTNSTGSFNTALGSQALGLNSEGNQNTAAGVQTLYQNTSGYDNSAFGYQALYSNTTSGSNSAFGIFALRSNTTGFLNTAVGAYALASAAEGTAGVALGAYALNSNTTGNNNTATGYSALGLNSTGSNNTANGYATLQLNAGGNDNAALGYLALAQNTAGSSNTSAGAFALNANNDGNHNVGAGYSALRINTSGTGNTAAGYFSLGTNTTGNYNTALGYNADVSAGDLVSATAIGANAVVNASNKIQLGSSTTVLATTGGVTIVSDGRFKESVRDNDVPGLDFINNLRPVTYNMNYKRYDEFLKRNLPRVKALQTGEAYESRLQEKSRLREAGFIAQDIEQLCKQKGYVFNGLYTPQNDNDNYAIDYSRLVVPLVKAVQELSQRNDALAQQNELLQNELADIKSLLLKQWPAAGAEITTKPRLQNSPNPFRGSTVIDYDIPSKFSSACIIVYDLSGKKIRQMPLPMQQAGRINFTMPNVAAGIYRYVLVADGKVAATRKMTVAR
ncbi:tail fiber domain-containing protein [Foetidibacter luteolus]|uniref:tail fiber domain-containing protein n=1 Tax=Foetidibacter luteolus TaxID=2608880 RepID=UPI00129C00F4|nr:tail fiber domain-containing protein [Foetidibacter luteolus]